MGYRDDGLVGYVMNALRFCYCRDVKRLDRIATLASVKDVHGSGELLARASCSSLIRRNCSISLAAAWERENVGEKSERGFVRRWLILPPLLSSLSMELLRCEFSRGFMGKLPVLGLLCSRFPERAKLVEHYAGMHPFSLDLLDKSCRLHASTKLVPKPDVLQGSCLPMDWTFMEASVDEAVALLEDDDEWRAALKTFEDSAEMNSIRMSLRHILEVSKLKRIDDMASFDRRCIAGDDKVGYQFVSSFYAEEFRDQAEFFGASLPVVDAALSRSGVNEDALVDQNEYVELFKELWLTYERNSTAKVSKPS
ncbi:hypothetical protein SELMODRAFT_421144 [Selaginella moellendorffii]|uniref:Uncharacterized protein n=1 Tax=Selaginella moellendorffii TaxID=88036 RepID=D8SEN1_SELML|nr:hypothetical protein SELMODRAFT_421144 [Selaginella moellendorffii]